MALSSSDPASLFNACRYAAWLAVHGIGAWGDSNWAGTRMDRRRTAILLSDRDEMERRLTPLLDEIRPNLVLIGAMSICFSGAVETAKLVRSTLGDNVCIVLGGRHTSETIYHDKLSDTIRHHAASPLRLMADRRIDEVFDIVLSGDGECFIAGVGELVAALAARGLPPRSTRNRLAELTYWSGSWIAGAILNGNLETVRSAGASIDYHTMPSPASMFGINAAFGIFDHAPTAHASSDIGQGCIYDCAFCSERISVVGPPRQMKSSVERLYDQLAAVRRVVDEDYSPRSAAAAFVEDSTFLGWNPALVRQFEETVDARGLDLRIGGQATIDQIVRNPDLAGRLRRVGLEYLFVGLETPVPDVVGGLHKDIGHRNGTWMDRANAAIDILAENGLSVGVSLLFGMGERPADRTIMFVALERWKSDGILKTISMNWAVQHPLKNTVSGPEYTYLDWAISPGPMLPLLRHFGEASECYTIAGGSNPTESEVLEIIDATKGILQQPQTTAHRNGEQLWG